MKMNFISTLFFFFISLPAFAQSPVLQASITRGSTPNSAKIFLKSNGDVTQEELDNGTGMSTLEFNVGILNTGMPRPTMTVTNSAFPLVKWRVDTITEGGYYHYYVSTGTSPIQFPFTADSEFVAWEVEFSSPIQPNTTGLVTMPHGGSNTMLAFYAFGTPSSDGSNLYYLKSGTAISNGYSYESGNSALGTDISTAIIVSALPVKLSNFTLTKRNNNGVLNWEVGAQDAGSSHFEIERSFTGSDFKNIGTVNILSSGQNYSFTDPNIAASHAGGIVYYRLKLMDKDGQFTYSDIKSLRLNAKAFALNLYPNPVKNIANLNIDLDVANTMRIVVSDAMGKQVRQMEFSGQKGLNRKTLDFSSLPSGSYMIKVQSGDQVQTIPIIKK